ncbi:MAG: ribosomal L7Ae/L30e/S12e/Gadd45 family protein [Eubacteriales bacterium]|nr:ribosomal L7Ae/L30e/S12e/Gadd45 family protein [Eubacteriales bacterium]
MPEELATKEKVVGIKQVWRLLRMGKAKQVYLACDADPHLTEPLSEACRNAGIPIITGFTMCQLGRSAGIEVGTAAAALTK